jgi:hypothetical protein
MHRSSGTPAGGPEKSKADTDAALGAVRAVPGEMPVGTGWLAKPSQLHLGCCLFHGGSVRKRRASVRSASCSVESISHHHVIAMPVWIAALRRAGSKLCHPVLHWSVGLQRGGSRNLVRMIVRSTTQRITAPWTEYRKVMGGIFGGVFLTGSLLMGVLGAAVWLILPFAFVGAYLAWAAVDARVFLAVSLSDGEVCFDGRHVEAQTVNGVGVAPWQHMGKIRTKRGVAVFVIVDGRRFFTPLCYSDEAEAVAMGKYLADFLSAEFFPEAFDVFVTEDLPRPSELWSRALRSALFLARGREAHAS